MNKKKLFNLLVFLLIITCKLYPQQIAQINSKISSSIDSLITTSIEKQHLPGVAVVLVQNNKILFKKGYGFANIEKQIKVDPDKTIFRIGSITKVFTSIGLLQLAERNQIRLDDDLKPYLNELSISTKYKEPIRFQHLLSHTAGFDQVGRNRQVKIVSERPSLKEFLKKEIITIRPPGLASCYDTYGITMAGYLLEKVSGLSYADYIMKNIFSPLGMGNSFVEIPEKQKANFALGYGYTKEAKYVLQPYEYYVTTPASSIDGTVNDMARFMMAILTPSSPVKNFLNSNTISSINKNAFRTHPSVPGFANGFWEDEMNGKRFIHHGGTMLGYTSEMHLVPDDGIGLFIVYNRDQEAGGGPANLRDEVVKLLMNNLYPPRENKKIASHGIDAKKYEGNFANNMYCHTCYENEGWPMVFMPVKSIGAGELEIDGVKWQAIQPGVFKSTYSGNLMAFIENEKGEVIRAVTKNRVFDKLGDYLLEEVLGRDWQKDISAPLIAQVYRANEDWQRAALAYEAIVAKRPADAYSKFYAGRCWAAGNNPDKGIRWFTEVWEMKQRMDWTGYGLAMCYAIKKEKEKTLEWIEKAIKAGFDEKEVFKEMQQFEFVRNDARFKELIK